MHLTTRRHATLIDLCAGYAKRAYDKEIEGEFIEDSATDAQAFVSFNDGDIIISGQGTTTMRDWSIDFQIWRTRVDYLDNVHIHAGFMKQYNAIRERIHTVIRANIEQCKRILCTGHSLFGALATIAALDCALMYDVSVHCITFGSPRVGGKDFAKLFNSSVDISYRCVQHKDPITFTPAPIRFRHVRGGLKFGVSDEHVNEPSLYNCIGCRIKHHSMITYASCAHSLIN